MEPSIKNAIIQTIYESETTFLHDLPRGRIITGSVMRSSNKLVNIGRYNSLYVDIDIYTFVGMKLGKAQKLLKNKIRKSNEVKQLLGLTYTTENEDFDF